MTQVLVAVIGDLLFLGLARNINTEAKTVNNHKLDSVLESLSDLQGRRCVLARFRVSNDEVDHHQDVTNGEGLPLH